MSLLTQRIKNTSQIHGSFTLRSGKISNTYFDKYKFEADPSLLFEIAKSLSAKVPGDIEVLAGLEMGGIPVVTMLSYITGLPAAFIRKKPKEYGTCKYSEGTDLKDKKILLIEDIVSSGGSIGEAANMLRSDHHIIDRVLCVIDRQTGGAENLAEAGVELISLFTQEEIEKGL